MRMRFTPATINNRKLHTVLVREALHPRNSNLASSQSSRHGPAMTDFMRELRDIRDRLAKQDVTIQDWASAADVSHTTLWRILERGQTPSVSTFSALVGAEKKFAPMQK